MKKLLILSIIILSALTINAQNLQVRDFRVARNIEMSANGKMATTHSSMKPYRTSQTTELSDSIAQFSDFIGYNLQKENIYLNILPLYELSLGDNGFDPKNDLRIGETLGFLVDFSLDDKLNVSYSLAETYGYRKSEKITPAYNFDYLWGLYSERNLAKGFFLEQTFNINYTPVEFFSIEAGNGRHFYGDGYRSLLQSDYSNNHPYLKIESEFLNFKYSCEWSMLYNSTVQNLRIDDINRHKYNVTHYLDCRIGKHVNVGLFESVMSSQFLSFEFFNPVVFFRPVDYSLGSDNNALLGANLKVSFCQKNCVYAQVVLDDIIVGQLKNDIMHRISKSYDGEYGWFANKWGIQGGLKFYDMFKVKGLDCFVEGNIVRPYAYSHSVSELTYTHDGKPLAHPLGANFIEGVAGISYFNEFIECNLKLSYAIAGADSSQNTHYGQNVFYTTMDAYMPSQNNIPVTSFYNVLLQGIRTNIFTARAEVAYYPLKDKALSVFAEILLHSNSNEIRNDKYLGFSVGVRSRLAKR